MAAPTTMGDSEGRNVGGENLESLGLEKAESIRNDLKPKKGLRSRRTYSFQKNAKERPDYIHREGHQVRLDKQLILDTTYDYNRYVVGGTTLRNLPIYDDCKIYDINPGEFADLISMEIDKIINFAKSESPPLFSSEGRLDGVSRRDFENLSGLADQMLCNLSILTHDNSRHGIEIPTMASDAWDDLIFSRRRLRSRYAQDESHVEGIQPATLPEPYANTVAYHQLLDYILGVIAWWTLRSADSHYWRKHLVAILAQWAVKMKVVARDPIGYAQLTLSETIAMINRLKYDAEFKEVMIKIGGKDRDIDVLETEFDLVNLYFEEKLLLRQHLGAIMETILEALMRHERSGNEAEAFEVCSMIRRNGLEGVTNMVTGQRHGNIVASSNLQHINICCSVFNLLKLNTARLEEKSKASPSLTPEESALNDVNVSMSWNSGENNVAIRTPTDFEVRAMDDFVSLMVPLALMNPKPASEVAGMMNLTNMLADAKDSIRQFAPPPRSFAVEYTLSTKRWREEWQVGNGKITDSDIKQLSQSPLRRGVQNCTMPLKCSTTNPIATLLDDYNSNMKTMSLWEISASSITVKCKTYVTAVQVASLVIILGALAVPFTVDDRIKGVDPFQITTFAWLTCGALLVIAKSRYVSSWPWHEFLRGVVVCRTVSDLSDVSRVDPQVILLYLLHNEWNSLLVSDGPYNGMFRRKTSVRSVSEEKNQEKREDNLKYLQGFSIDEPVHLITMLTSGIVVLKAMNASGEHLVCIDGRKGGYDAAMPGERRYWMTCPDFNTDGLENARGSGINEKDIDRKIHMLRRVAFRWTKIQGIYVKDSRFG